MSSTLEPPLLNITRYPGTAFAISSAIREEPLEIDLIVLPSHHEQAKSLEVFSQIAQVRGELLVGIKIFPPHSQRA
jgi:hypothetical protein